MPSLIILALELLVISTSITFERDTFQTLETLKIYKISDEQIICSYTSGDTKPEL